MKFSNNLIIAIYSSTREVRCNIHKVEDSVENQLKGRTDECTRNSKSGGSNKLVHSTWKNRRKNTSARSVQ